MNKTRGKSALDPVDNENILQAVVVIDTFTQNLNPFCCFMPSSLLHLANRPLLGYTFDCLYSSGVQETIVFCPAYAEKIKEHLRKEKWPGMTISIVVSEGCRTLGDVMRDLDSKALIRTDFILLTGNLVGNLQLLPALEKHKRLQKTDKGAVMSLIFKECGKRWKAPEDDFTVALDAKTNKVLLYNKRIRNPGKLEIPLETLLETPEVELRCDLLDTQVSICSLAVPPLFSDNFDFQTREDFVRGMLVSEEVATSSIYAQILPSGQYAATVISWAHYQDITHDVIHRWVYPQVPDLITDDPYFFRRNNIYVQKNITLQQGCRLVEDVVIASGTTIGLTSTLTRSVVGKNCCIGNNVTIENAYIMDNVTIGDGCRVSYAILGQGVTLRSQCSVTEGSVLADGVVIDSGKHISAMILQAKPSSSCAEDAVCSKAYLFKSISDDDSDSDSETNEVATGLVIRKDEVDDEWEESSESDDEVTRSVSPVPEDTNLFYSEVVDSLVRGYEDRLPCDNLCLEINSSRYAYNVTMSEVNTHVIRALLTMDQERCDWVQMAARLKYFMPIMTNYIRSEAAQRDCLAGIEDAAATHPHVFDNAVKIVHYLYDNDVLSEEVILHWYEKPHSDCDMDFATRIRKQVSSFIRWLREADEQSEDED